MLEETPPDKHSNLAAAPDAISAERATKAAIAGSWLASAVAHSCTHPVPPVRSRVFACGRRGRPGPRPGRPVAPLTLSSPEIRSGGQRVEAPACWRSTPAAAWPNRRRPAPGRSLGAAPPCGRGSRQNRRQREVVSRSLRFRFSACSLVGATIQAPGKVGHRKPPIPSFYRPGISDTLNTST
jgi:hypothetical protein